MPPPLAALAGRRPAAPAWFDAALANQPQREHVIHDGVPIEVLSWGPRGAPGLLLVLVSDDAPTRAIACAGAGSYALAHVTLNKGVHLGFGADVPERLAAAWAQLAERGGDSVPASGAAQGTQEVGLALAARR